MSIQQDPQETLPDPPTGVALVIAEHVYNPETGHYDPSLRNRPLTAGATVTVPPAAAALLITVVAGAPVWIYHLVLANLGGNERVTITEPGNNTYIVDVPANQTIPIVSTPQAPIFVSRVAGPITVAGDAGGNIRVTAMYVTK